MNYFSLVKFQLRKKSNYIVAVIIGLIIGIATLVYTYETSWKNYLNKDVYEDITFRNLHIQTDNETSEEELQKLQALDYVSNVTYMYEYLKTYEIEDLTTNAETFARADFYTANNESLPQIVKGTDFPDDDGYYMVCPENFYSVLYNYEDLRTKTTSDKDDLSYYLNKELTLKYNGVLYNATKSEKYIFRTKVKLVGLYKNSQYSIDETTCYLNHNAMHDIVLNEYTDALNDYENQKNNGYILTVDSANHMDEVKENLDKLGYYYQDVSYIETDYLNNIFNNIDVAIFIVLILVFIFVFFIFKKDFKEDKAYYELLKKVGFNNSEIKKVYFLTSIIKSVIYICFITIITLIIFLLLKVILNYFPYLFVKYKVIYDYKIILYTLLILMFNLIINVFLNSRKVTLK